METLSVTGYQPIMITISTSTADNTMLSLSLTAAVHKISQVSLLKKDAS